MFSYEQLLDYLIENKPIEVNIEKFKSKENKNLEIVESQLSKELENYVVPLFCPVCGKLMNSEADKKAYYRCGCCSDCYIKNNSVNNKEREKQIVKENILIYLKEVKQQIENFLKDYSPEKQIVTNSIGDITTFSSGKSKKEMEQELWKKYNELVIKVLEEYKKEYKENLKIVI